MGVIRSVFSQGHSLVVTIPAYMLDQIGVNESERRVVIEVFPGQFITVTKYQAAIHGEKRRAGLAPG